MGAAWEYFPEKIHWPDESLASKQAARERGTFDAIFARVFARDARKKREKERRRQAKRAEEKNRSTRDRKLASRTIERGDDRQGG